MKRRSPQIKFRGSLVGMRVEAAKVREIAAGFSRRKRQEISGGAVIVMLRLEKPELPTAPVKTAAELDYQLRYAHDPGPEPEAFEEPTQDEGETPATFRKRAGDARDKDKETRTRWATGKSQWDRRQAIEAAHEAKFEEAMQAYQAEVEALGAAQDEYTRIAGYAATLAGIPFDVTLSPRQSAVTAFLPGWSGGGAQQPLLSAPANE